MNWQEYLTDNEKFVLDSDTKQRDIARDLATSHSKRIARIRNTCVNRARRASR